MSSLAPSRPFMAPSTTPATTPAAPPTAAAIEPATPPAFSVASRALSMTDWAADFARALPLVTIRVAAVRILVMLIPPRLELLLLREDDFPPDLDFDPLDLDVVDFDDFEDFDDAERLIDFRPPPDLLPPRDLALPLFDPPRADDEELLLPDDFLVDDPPRDPRPALLLLADFAMNPPKG